ncbi:YeeE/YedE family protein [Halococcoides cellulosivorans]|nr:YeeE/YedE thiosulfate transporter family protein [Halococcoides cellulosivorans]
MLELFPNGVVHYAAGGVLIGVGVSLIYLLTGIAAGASSVLESTLTYVSSLDRLNRPSMVESRGWRLVFSAGLVLGAAAYTVLAGEGIWTTEVPIWRLLGGGVLVGVGTRLGKGCTSGHGICGIGSVAGTSLANVATFLGVAILVAHLIEFLGGAV